MFSRVILAAFCFLLSSYPVALCFALEPSDEEAQASNSGYDELELIFGYWDPVPPPPPATIREDKLFDVSQALSTSEPTLEQTTQALQMLFDSQITLNTDINSLEQNTASGQSLLANLSEEVRRLRDLVNETIEVSIPKARTEGQANAIEYVVENEETPIYLRLGEPTLVEFPAAIEGGFRTKHSSYSLERDKNQLVLFLNKTTPNPKGEGILVMLKDGRICALRLLEETPEHSRDVVVRISD
jgi:hypothetical protein